MSSLGIWAYSLHNNIRPFLTVETDEGPFSPIYDKALDGKWDKILLPSEMRRIKAQFVDQENDYR